MADNYLERRMEELRNGKLTVRGSVPGIKPGSKRVIVVGGTAGKARETALDYRKQGSRVAVFDSDEYSGKKMAYENGVRFHHVDLDDMDAVSREVKSLLSYWRNVDVIVATSNTYEIFSKFIDHWKESQPIPDKSKVEIVII